MASASLSPPGRGSFPLRLSTQVALRPTLSCLGVGPLTLEVACSCFEV